MAAAAAMGSEEGEESEGDQGSARLAQDGVSSRSGRKKAKRARQAQAAGQQPLLQQDQDFPVLLPSPQPAAEQAQGPAAIPSPPVPSPGQVGATLLGALGEQHSSTTDLGFYLVVPPKLAQSDKGVHAGLVAALAASPPALAEWLRSTAAHLQASAPG